MPRRRRDGFDYFVDRYETSYVDDEFYSDDYIPGDRFQKYNRYTGEIQGKPRFIDTSTVYFPQRQGTMEFSALPGQGGLNPNVRPLGEQTMMITPINPYSQGMVANITPVAPNPYLQQTMMMAPNPYMQQPMAPGVNTQQIQMQQMELSHKIDNLGYAMNTLAMKVDNTAAKIDATGTLTFRNPMRTEEIPARRPHPVARPVPAPTQTIQASPAIVPAPVVQPTATVAVPKTQQKPKKKKKLSKGVIIGGTIGIIVAIALIVVGVLLIVGIISF